MTKFVKNYHIYFWILLTALLIYNYNFLNTYKKLYKSEGLYTVGKITNIKAYGRGSGFDFVYRFEVNDKKYESQCDIGNLNFHEANTFVNGTFLIVYLKSNIDINRIYVSIPVSKNLNSLQLNSLIQNNPELKKKLDSIPSSG